MADLLETPSRLLKRVQQYEEMDLPSLPSISHDVDCDQTTEYSDPDISSTSGKEEWLTPQVGRPFPTPPKHEPPFTAQSRYMLSFQSDPLASNESLSDFKSSPRYQLSDEGPSFLADLSRSHNIPSRSTMPGTNESDFWEDSMNSKRLSTANACTELESGVQHTSLPETSVESSITSVMDTPMPHHHRQHKSVPSSQPTGNIDSRIPSLTRSEVSGTDHEATTPEGHDRSLPAATHPNSGVSSVADELSVCEQAEPSASPLIKSTPTSIQTVTPAMIRYMDTPSTAARAAATPFGVGAALRDITRRYTNLSHATGPGTPFTPSVDYNKTPRAALNDAERRRNHVLSVLASSALPSRTKRFAPPPGRDALIGPESGSISEESPPQDPPNEGNGLASESFISVASSQDLTPERRGSRAFGQRANTSVPNILYSGALASPGVSHLDNRPDTVKIQKHLNMMNQQLLDNNADLAREAEEWRGECTRLIGIMRDTGIQIDDDGNVLCDLPNLHRDESLELAAATSEQGTSCNSIIRAATEKQIKALEDQLREKDNMLADLRASRDKAGPPQPDLQRSAELEKELEDARQAHEMLKEDFAQKTKDHTAQFAEICTEYEAQVQRLEHQLASQARNLGTADVMDGSVSEDRQGELRARRNRMQDEEDGFAESAKDLSRLRKQAREYLDKIECLQQRILELETLLEAAVANKEVAIRKFAELEEACDKATSEKDAAINDVQELRARLDGLERLAAAHQSVMEDQRETLKRLEDLAAREHQDLEDAQNTLREARQDLRETQLQLSEKDQQIEALRGQVDIAALERSLITDDKHPTIPESSFILALEERLDAAYKEIGRLKHNAAATPITRTALESRDTRISALETEKLALMERLKAQEVSSPARWSSSVMSSTPLHKTVASLKLPNTPGILRDISWLHSTVGDSDDSVLRAQLGLLQHELDMANSQLDRNFARLEEAGHGAVELAEKLAIAKDRIGTLEEELATLAREKKKSMEVLSAGQDRNERLENALEVVRQQLTVLKDDMDHEKERLQNDNRRLRVMLFDMQVKADEEIEALRVEIARLQRDADDQSADMQQQLCDMREERDAAESKLESVQITLQTLEADLNTARSAAAQSETTGVVIRNQAAEVTSQRDLITLLQKSLKEVHQSKAQVVAECRSRTQALEVAQQTMKDQRLEHISIARELADFCNDLDIQRRECAKFESELDTLRREQAADHSRQATKLADLRIDVASARQQYLSADKEAEEAKNRCAEMSRELAACAAELRDNSSEQRQRYKAQTRRLSAQIEYLKAKYTRENTFRNALALQKKFLLLLVGGMSLTEQATLKAIASMGFGLSPGPPSQHARPRRSLKAVAIAVLSVVRARRIAKEWRMSREDRAVGTARG